MSVKAGSASGPVAVKPVPVGGAGRVADEPADRPDSVGHLAVIVATIHLRAPSPAPSCGLPADSGEQPSDVCAGRPRTAGPFGLAPGGVYRAAPVARGAGGLLHHRFTLARTAEAVTSAAAGGLLSVALSRGSPRVGVAHHRALWSPDLPRRDTAVRAAAAWPARPRRSAYRPPCPGPYAGLARLPARHATTPARTPATFTWRTNPSRGVRAT